MKRILLPTLAVLLIAAAASLFVKLSECEATTARVPAFDVVEVAANAVAEVPDESPAFAQSASEPFVEPDATFSSGRSSKRTIKVPVTKVEYRDVTVEMEEVTPLQQRYSVLMLKRAQRMTDEQLEQAIAEIEAELKEQDEAANTELQKAIEILESLQQESDGTPAARRAGQAIPILQGKQPPKGAVPHYNHGVPQYNPGPTSSIQFEEAPLNPVPTY